MSHPGLSPGGAASDVQIKSGVQTEVHMDRGVGANMGEPSEDPESSYHLFYFPLSTKLL